jgi:hypothetical protein
MGTSYWGPYTWVFMHSFIALMTDDLYVRSRDTIVRFIKRICASLPCDNCRKHAVEYTKRLHPGAVPTRKHMAHYLFTFHNKVNARLKKPQFANFGMYDSAKMGEVFVRFRSTFARPVSGAIMMNMTRRALVTELQSFLESNQKEFTWNK